MSAIAQKQKVVEAIDQMKEEIVRTVGELVRIRPPGARLQRQSLPSAIPGSSPAERSISRCPSIASEK